MLAPVVAQTASGDAPPFDIFSLLLPLALVFLIFTMFRRNRRSQQQVKQMRTQMEPGTEVMTQFGLYGTIVSIDQENNRAVLELSPGNFATVHTQALSKVVQQDAAVADVTVGGTDDDARGDLDAYGGAVPDDASSIDGIDRTPSGGATAAGAATTGPGTPGEAAERLDEERAAREDRDPRDPRVNPDN